MIMNYANPTIVRGRCSGCKTPWTLDTRARRVTYQPPGIQPIVIPTDDMLGDHEWSCPVVVDVNLDPLVTGDRLDADVDIICCNAGEAYDADQDWAVDR